MHIQHLAIKEEWLAAVEAGSYERSTRGASLADVGFIHMSLPSQLPRVAAFVYADCAEELVVATFSLETIVLSGTEVRFEDGGTGELFPHVYGPLKPSWASAVKDARMESGALVID